MHELLKRWLIVFLGSFIISLGVAIIVKTNLGISPITSIPLVLSLKFPISLGTTMLGWNFMLIVLQLGFLKRDFGIKHLSQVIISIIYSILLDFSTFLIRDFHPDNFMFRLFLLIVGCFFVALGMVFESSPRLVQSPATGFVVTISEVLKKPIHIVKNTADVILVLIATTLSYIFFREIQGVGVGTVVTALSVGPMMGFIMNKTPLLKYIPTGKPKKTIDK